MGVKRTLEIREEVLVNNKVIRLEKGKKQKQKLVECLVYAPQMIIRADVLL